MTKKDYELIAEVILLKRRDIEDAKQMRYITDDTPRLEVINELAEDIADRLSLDDERFKRNKFLADCGITNGKL